MTALHYAAKNDNDFVLAYLLKKGAKFEPDANGLYFTTFALKSENRKAARAVVFSERWAVLHNRTSERTDWVYPVQCSSSERIVH